MLSKNEASSGDRSVSSSLSIRIARSRTWPTAERSPSISFSGFRPKHRAPQVVVDADLTVDGWIPVDPYTLQTKFTDVYAVGDVTSVGTPKAGVFSEGQASVVAEQILARVHEGPEPPTYDGHGVCYLEFGHDMVAKVAVTFVSGQAPVGTMEGPSADIATDKTEFGASRIMRWFGHGWKPTGATPSGT